MQTTIDPHAPAESPKKPADAHEIAVVSDDVEPVELMLSFEGNARDYFKIWSVNLCLTLLTFGVFSAWAKVRKKRFIYSHMRLDGTPFEYLGRPLPILKGRIIAAVLLVVWTLCLNARPKAIPFVLTAFALVLPWILVRSAAFNARASAYRNLTLDFSASYRDGVKLLLKGALITLVTLGFGFPIWRHRLARFFVEHTSYGGIRGTFGATSKPFLEAYYAALLLIVPCVLGTLFLFALFAKSPSESVFILAALPGYIGYVFALVFARTRMRNAIWNHAAFGPVRFRARLRARDVLWLYLTNAVAILASFGLLVPWAEMRMLRYRTSRLTVILDGTLGEFHGARTNATSATGAEVADFFDLDVAL